MTELKYLKEVFIFKGNGQFIFLCNPQKSFKKTLSPKK